MDEGGTREGGGGGDGDGGQVVDDDGRAGVSDEATGGDAGRAAPPGQPALERLRALVVHPGHPWTVAHLLSLGLATVVLLVANRNQWFFGDEWAFITRRGPGFGDLDLFRPHNEHWSTIPLLVYWALLSTVGLSRYLPYAAVLIVLHLGLTHLLWRACLRAGARPAIATGVAGVFAVLGAGAENLLWAFQIGFVGAVAFGWAAVLLHDHDGPFDRRDVAGWAASVVALMFSGSAPFLVGVATLTVWFRRRRLLDAVLTAALPAVVFGVWWLLEGRHATGAPEPRPEDRWSIVEWAWRGLAHAAESVVGVPETGGFLVLVLLVWWARHLDLAWGRAALALAGTAGAGAFYLATATSRVSLGFEAAEASRYVYVAAALLLPAVALALSRSVPPTAAATLLVLGLCGVVALHNVGLLRDETSEEALREQRLRGTVVATAPLLHRDGNVATNGPGGRANPDLTVEALSRVDGYGWLPDIATAPADELTAEAITQVAFVPSDRSALGAVSITADGVELTEAPSVDGASCVEAWPLSREATVTLSSGTTPWRVRLRGPEERSIRVRLVDGDDAGYPLRFTLSEGASDLVSGAEGLDAAVTLPRSGPVTICGVTPPR